jgi:hypothetical protein
MKTENNIISDWLDKNGDPKIYIQVLQEALDLQLQQQSKMFSEQQVISFSKWKDDNFLMYGNKTYYAKTSSNYFDVTKYVGKEKPTKYFTVEELFEQFKKITL